MDYQANRQASDEAIKETTATLCTGVLSEPDDSAAATAAEGALVVVPNSSALLVVKRGPNAGSRYQLDKLVTSAGRNNNSDIYLDDVTVSRIPAVERRIPARRPRQPQRHLRQRSTAAPIGPASRRRPNPDRQVPSGNSDQTHDGLT